MPFDHVIDYSMIDPTLSNLSNGGSSVNRQNQSYDIGKVDQVIDIEKSLIGTDFQKKYEETKKELNAIRETKTHYTTLSQKTNRTEEEEAEFISLEAQNFDTLIKDKEAEIALYREQLDKGVNSEMGAIAKLRDTIEKEKEIINIISKMSPLAFKLDSCIPGPNYGWEERLDSLFRRRFERLSSKVQKDDADEANATRYNEIQKQFTLYKPLVKINAIAPKVADTVPEYRKYEATIKSAINFMSKLTDWTDKTANQGATLSQMETIYESWKATNSTESKKEIITRFQLLSSEIYSVDATYQESIAALDSIKLLNNEIKTNTTKCISDRGVLYSGESAFAEAYYTGSNQTIKTLDFDSILADKKMREVYSTVAKFSPVGILLKQTNAKETEFREKLNNVERSDPELNAFCTDFFNEVAPTEPNKMDELLRLDGVVKLGAFQKILWNGFVCNEYYFGSQAAYFPKY